MSEINDILNSINLILSRKKNIQLLLDYFNSATKNLIYIGNIDTLNKIATYNDNTFKNGMGLNTNIEGNTSTYYQANFIFGKSINHNDFIEQVSANERAKLLEYYKDDVNIFFENYVDTSDTKDNTELLKRKLILLCLRFQISAFMPQLPVPTYDKIGKTMGFQKLLSNIVNYKKDYKLENLSKTNKIPIEYLNEMVTNYFEKNKDFLKDPVVDYSNKKTIIIETCNKQPILLQETKSISEMEKVGSITHKKCLQKIMDDKELHGFINEHNMQDVSDFLMISNESGIIILPWAKVDSSNQKINLVIIRCITKVDVPDNDPELRKLFVKKGIDALSEIIKLKEEMSWKTRYIIDYRTIEKIDEFLKYFDSITKPIIELYLNNTPAKDDRFLIALSQKNDMIYQCPMFGNVTKITGKISNNMLTALKNRNGKPITILDKRMSSDINGKCENK